MEFIVFLTEGCFTQIVYGLMSNLSQACEEGSLRCKAEPFTYITGCGEQKTTNLFLYLFGKIEEGMMLIVVRSIIRLESLFSFPGENSYFLFSA